METRPAAAGCAAGICPLSDCWQRSATTERGKKKNKNQPSQSGASLELAWARHLTLIQSKGLLLLEEEQDNSSFSWYKAAERGGRRGSGVNHTHPDTQVRRDCLEEKLQQEDQILFSPQPKPWLEYKTTAIYHWELSKSTEIPLRHRCARLVESWEWSKNTEKTLQAPRPYAKHKAVEAGKKIWSR